jgi:hypothetical protein
MHNGTVSDIQLFGYMQISTYLIANIQLPPKPTHGLTELQQHYANVFGNKPEVPKYTYCLYHDKLGFIIRAKLSKVSVY